MALPRPGTRQLKLMQEGLREAEHRRAEAMIHVQDMCDRGESSQVMRWLIPAMMSDPALRKIRLWQLDHLMHGVSRDTAIRWVNKARADINDSGGVQDGNATLGWALENREASVRMVSWMWNIMIRERHARFTPPNEPVWGQLTKGADDPIHFVSEEDNREHAGRRRRSS